VANTRSKETADSTLWGPSPGVRPKTLTQQLIALAAALGTLALRMIAGYQVLTLHFDDSAATRQRPQAVAGSDP